MNKNQLIGFLVGTTISLFFASEKYRRELEVERDRTLKAVRLIHYMANIIEEHEVPTDEFDVIAIQTLVQGINDS